MLENISIQSILFLDIETVSNAAKLSDLDDYWQSMWHRKASLLKKDDDLSPEEFYARAAIYSEFGKIVCISCGFISVEKHARLLRIKSFCGHNEKEILLEFAKLINTHFSKAKNVLCAHNGKEFDFPFIARRMLVNGIPIPRMLDIAGKKPWEVQHLDTMELWKFGDYKNYTPLNVLANVLEIANPKEDMDGSMVHKVYWEDH